MSASKSSLEVFRKKLLQMLDHLTHERQSIKDESLGSADIEVTGGLSKVPVHPGDLASHDLETEVNFRLVENEEELLKEVTEALERIEQGTYGICENCGKPIARQRLKVIPYTRYCIRCAEKLEPHT